MWVRLLYPCKQNYCQEQMLMTPQRAEIQKKKLSGKKARAELAKRMKEKEETGKGRKRGRNKKTWTETSLQKSEDYSSKQGFAESV